MRKIIFGGLLLASALMMGSFAEEARAQSNSGIQMLPPVGCTAQSEVPVQVARGVIGWDGANKMACIPKVSFGSNGSLTLPTYIDIGTADESDCNQNTPGAVRYNADADKKYMEYCDGTNWRAFGAGSCLQQSAVKVFSTYPSPQYLTVDMTERGRGIQRLIPGTTLPLSVNGQILPIPLDPTKGGGIMYIQCVNGTFMYVASDLGCKVVSNGSVITYDEGTSWMKGTHDTPMDQTYYSICSCVKGVEVCSQNP